MFDKKTFAGEVCPLMRRHLLPSHGEERVTRVKC